MGECRISLVEMLYIIELLLLLSANHRASSDARRNTDFDELSREENIH